MTSSDWQLRRSEASSSPAVTSFARRAAVAERIVPLAAANAMMTFLDGRKCGGVKVQTAAKFYFS